MPRLLPKRTVPDGLPCCLVLAAMEGRRLDCPWLTGRPATVAEFQQPFADVGRDHGSATRGALPGT